MFEQYEINLHLLAAVAVIVAAGSVFLIFSNIQSASPTYVAFDRALCADLLQGDSRNAQLSTYYRNYHIDGSAGDAVGWDATEPPLDRFPILLFPKLFFVHSDTGFEGCGRQEDVANREKTTLVLSSFNFSSCANGLVYVGKEIKESYKKVSIYAVEAGKSDRYTLATVLMSPRYEYGNGVLQTLGCLT